MPWQGVCPMELRMRLVNALVAEEDSMTALCAEYGVSRKTGYKWLMRFRAQGPAGLAERSRAPQVVPWAVTQAQTEAIIAMRRQHPSWGPKKLRAKLLARAPAQHWPAQSTSVMCCSGRDLASAVNGGGGPPRRLAGCHRLWRPMMSGASISRAGSAPEMARRAIR